MYGRVFPLDPGEDDPRFSTGMIKDVASAMERHGYPPFAAYSPVDVTELHLTLFGFLYRGGDF
ncbi:hypothetical protein [Bounagaea algeriensis]